jgi:hypothetical protein
MNVFAWVLSALGPLVIRAIAAAGFTMVTFAGVTALLQQLVSDAQARWSAIPSAILQLATLAGVPQVLGMLVGAYMARAALWASINAARYVLKG